MEWRRSTFTYGGRRLGKVEVSVEKHGDVVLAGLQSDGECSAAILKHVSKKMAFNRAQYRKPTFFFFFFFNIMYIKSWLY